MGLTEHPSLAASALAVNPAIPPCLVTSKAAVTISSLENLNFGGILLTSL